mgnify:CR=1 FL=1
MSPWPTGLHQPPRSMILPTVCSAQGHVQRWPVCARSLLDCPFCPSGHFAPPRVLPYGIGMSSSQVRLSDAGTFSANSLLVLTAVQDSSGSSVLDGCLSLGIISAA